MYSQFLVLQVQTLSQPFRGSLEELRGKREISRALVLLRPAWAAFRIWLHATPPKSFSIESSISCEMVPAFTLRLQGNRRASSQIDMAASGGCRSTSGQSEQAEGLSRWGDNPV
jgi:hypothetical protein